MVEFIVEMLAEALLHVAGFVTGWLVVPLFSLGRIVVEPARRGGRVLPKWHRVRRAADGSLILDAEMGALAGLLFWVVVGAAWFMVRRALA